MDFEKIKHFFGREIYGLPVWGWSLIVAGGVGLGWYLTKQGSSFFGSIGGGTGTAPQQPTEPAQPPTATPNPVTAGPAPPVTATPIASGDNGGGGPISTPTNPIQPVASQPSGGLPSPILTSIFRGVSEGEQSFRDSQVQNSRTAVQHSGSTEGVNIGSAGALVANVANRSLVNQNTVSPRAANQPYQSVIGRARAS